MKAQSGCRCWSVCGDRIGDKVGKESQRRWMTTITETAYVTSPPSLKWCHLLCHMSNPSIMHQWIKNRYLTNNYVAYSNVYYTSYKYTFKILQRRNHVVYNINKCPLMLSLSPYAHPRTIQGNMEGCSPYTLSITILKCFPYAPITILLSPDLL